MVYSVERSRAPGRCLFGLLRHRSARHPRPIDRPGEGALQLLSVSGVGRDLLAKEASPDPIRSRGMLFRRSGAAALIGGRGRAERMDEHFLACALTAMAAAKGFPAIAEAVQELTPLVAAEFLEWFRAR
jgi:hypothetical protein